jgi:hypothetical protein
MDLTHFWFPRRPRPVHVLDAAIDELYLGELKLKLRIICHAHLSVKPTMSGRVKPACGQHQVAGGRY